MRWILSVCLPACLFFLSVHLGAEPKVIPEITEISRHSLLVNFSWRVTIYSDKAWDGCDLKISSRDKSGKEIHLIHEVIKLKVGKNEYSGTDICDTDTWKRIEKRVTVLDCVF